MTTRVDNRVRALIAAASRLALREPDAAMRVFAQAAELGATTGCDGIAHAYEAMGRLALTRGELPIAREALELAEREATRAGDALVVARSRAMLASIERSRPYASSPDAFAAELRFASDLLDAAQISLAPMPALHAARTRLELRRRLDTPDGLPAIGRVEIALALDAMAVAVLAICASLTLEPEIARALPPAAMPPTEEPAWSDIIAAWLAPGIDEVDVETVLANLARRGLIRRDDAGRPELAPEVESLLAGRTQPVLPDGFARVTSTPIWREGPTVAPPGPAQPPRVLAIVGGAAAAIDHATQLAWARGWPLWIARPQPSASRPTIQRGIRALAREALVHDRLLGLALDGVDPETVRLALGEATSLLDRLVVLAPERPVVMDSVLITELAASSVVPA
jgi:hypothetical protein